MAMTMRAPSMLPAIKCSDCGHDVEISMMGEHVCSGSSQRDTPRSHAYPQRVDSPQQLPAAHDNRHQLKPTRFVPPRIDPYAANQPYAQRNAYTTTSASTPDTSSPISPFPTRPHGQPRNGSSHKQPPRPQHPGELSSNLDCAFPPFPASPMISTPRSDNSSPGFFSDPNPYALAAPQTQQVRSASPLSQQSQHERDEAKRDAFFSRKPSDPVRPPYRRPTHGSDDAPSAAAPIQRKPLQQPSRPEPQPTAASYSKAPPTRPTRPGGEVDNFLASLKEDAPRSQSSTPPPLAANMRSNTFPHQQSFTSLERRPSEPLRAARPANQLPERAATTNDLRNPYGPPPVNDLYPPPRSSSRSGMRPDPCAYNAPPVPSTHVSSPSSSSAASSVSAAGSDARTGRTTPFSEVSSVSGRSPPRVLHSAGSKLTASPESNNPYNPYGGTTAQRPTWEPPNKAYAPAPMNTTPSPPRRQPGQQPERSLPWSSRDFTAPPPPLTRTDTSSSLTSQPSTSKPRHNCRGCHAPITGKSIQSADGRLTGRYHRACFACTTCHAPFADAQVHVLRDQPYCAYHYHALNGSLCKGCDRGIEGQYLETERGEKHHPRCLCCRTCREPLGGEYFDVKGGMYCERHAVAEVRRLGGQGGGQQGKGGLTVGGGARAERRITRLGMFM